MKSNKKLNIDELKILVFEKNQATKNQKTKLFKLAKANNDMETIERLRDDCDFKSAKMYLDKLHNMSTEDIIKNRDCGNLKKIIDNEFDESKMGIEDLYPWQYETHKEYYKDDSTVADNTKMVITSPFDTTPELHTAEGVRRYQSRLSKLTHSELSIEFSNVMAAKHNLMSFPTHPNEAKKIQEKITDLTDKSLAICMQNFGNNVIINYGDGDISKFIDLVNTIDTELAQEVLNSEQHGSKMLDTINIALSDNDEDIAMIEESSLSSSSFIVQCFDSINKTIPSPLVAKQFVLEELNAAYISDNDDARKWAKNSGYQESEYKDAMSKSFVEVEEGPQLKLRQILMPLFSQENFDNKIIFELTTKIVDKVMNQYSLGKYASQDIKTSGSGKESKVEDIKKSNIEELKKLVFEKNKATKSNKDKLFKLSKANGDLETIVKMKDKLGFKSARMYLDKMDKLSVEDAIKNRNFELFKKFVENGADISKIRVADLIDKKYDDEFIKLFIDKDYYVNVAQLTKKNYKSATIKLAIENGAKVDDTYENFTGIAHASIMGRVDIVKLLLEYNPNINKQFSQGITALFFSLESSHNEISKLLIENGAEIEAKMSNGFTPLIQAASNNNIDTVKLLLEKGTNINAQSGNKGTALMFAIMNNENVEMTKSLLENGANPNIAESVQGLTALDWAEINNNSDLINLVMTYGGKRGKDSSEDVPKLIEAFVNNDIEKAKKLLELKHDIDEVFNGFTALMEYSAVGNIEMVNTLLNYGANINYQTKQGFTALIAASQQGQYDIVKNLIRRGANKNIKGYHGFTALNVAKSTQNSDIVALLNNSKSIETNNLKDLMKERVQNDYKELISHKVEELGVEKAEEYLKNISSPDELQKEIGSIKKDSTPFIEKSLRRITLTNEEMSKNITIKGVGTYDGVFLHKSLRGIRFTSIQTSIGYFLDFPYHTSIIDPYSNSKLPNGIDWSNKIGTTIKKDDYLTFAEYSNHIFINSTKVTTLENRCFYSYKNNEYKLIKKIQKYDYENTSMYDEFLSLVENYSEENDNYLEKFYLDNCQDLDVDKLNINGNTALLSASWRGNVEAVKLLSFWGADINFQNKEGYTPLMLATDRGYYEICKNLLDNGAKPNIKNYRGQDISIFAAKNMNPEIIILFEDYDIEIKNVQKYIVDNTEEKNALDISKLVEQKLQTKEEISEFLIFALNYNYEYELDLDYYIEKTKDYLVSVKLTRETKFTKTIVDLYYDLHNKYLDKINASDESKNHIRTRIFDILMEKYQLGKYENSRFEEIEGEEHLYTLKILSDEISGNIDIFDNHITLKILNDESKIISFEYAQQSDGSYINKDRGEIIISKKSIIEKNRSGGQRVSKYIKIDNDILDTNKSNHNPQALSDKLKKFSSDKRLRYTNHPWTDKTFKNFYTDLNKGWDEIRNDIEILSPTLFKSINKFLFATNNTDTVGFSSDTIKEQLESGNKKPDLIKSLNESINTFKQSILIKNDENQTLLDLFERVLDKSNLDLDLDLEGIEDFTGRFYTDVRKLEEAIELILKDINKIDSDAEIKIIADSSEDPITLKIIHKGSTYNDDSKILLKTIGTTGNFTSIHGTLKSVCHWDVEAKCTDGVQTIHYLYPQRDGVTPYADPKSTEVEGFTHILRFYK